MYNAIKTDLATWIGISKDALHIHIGLAIFFALVLILRRRPASIVPWLGLLGLELLNEVIDVFHWHEGAFSFEVGDALKDIVNTMIWPSVALLTLRFIERRRKPSAVTATLEADT